MGVSSGKNVLVLALLNLGTLFLTPVRAYYADVKDLGSLHEILLARIISYPLSQFESDPELVQEVNKVNLSTNYKFQEEDFILFSRPLDDTSKKVVVLTRQQDKIPFRKGKRGYVVFRKNPLDSTYYGEFAFIRPTTSPYDKNTVLINGDVRSAIEWIPFDGHWVKGRFPKKEIAMTCVSSVFVSCLFSRNLLRDPKTVKWVPATSPYTTKAPSSGEIAETEILQWITHDESDPDENYDYYADITLGPITGPASEADIYEALEGKARDILCISAPETCNFNETELPTIGLLPIMSTLGLKNGSVIGRRKRDAEIEVTLKSPAYYPGWKTQYVTTALGPGSYLITPKPAEFYGFGNCPFNNTLGPEYLFNNASSVDDYLTFYLTILRVGCISSMKPLMEEILRTGVLILDQERKIFEVMLHHKYLTREKLATDEFVYLTTALEFAIFTQNYVSHFSPIIISPEDNDDEPNNDDTLSTSTSTPAPTPVVVNYTTPTGKPGSQSLAFLTTVIIDYLKTIRIKARPHLLHLTRSMAQNTRFILFKLAQDGRNLAQACQAEGCAKDKAVNFNDRMQVMALNQFIKRGLGPVEKELVDMDDAFLQFYRDNESNIEKLVTVYYSP